MVKQFREAGVGGCPAKAAREAGSPHVKVNKGWSNPHTNTTHKTYLRMYEEAVQERQTQGQFLGCNNRKKNAIS